MVREYKQFFSQVLCAWIYTFVGRRVMQISLVMAVNTVVLVNMQHQMA